jgi:hypothetical protein
MFPVVKSSATKPAKKPYSTPKLITHGDVAVLTQKFKRPKSHGNGPSDID